jgi:hypothetical protein
MYSNFIWGAGNEREKKEGTYLVVERRAFRSTFFQYGDRFSLDEGQGHADRHQEGYL